MSRTLSKDERGANDIFISYRNSVLRTSDIKLLEGDFWLNDAVLGFYFEYLDNKYRAGKYQYLFVSPELTQLLKLTEYQEYPTFLDPISAKQRDFAFFPVNDCTSRSAAGGTHWSLMVFSKRERKCFYYDSSKSKTSPAAKEFSKKLMNYFLDGSEGEFVAVEDCPSQNNGHDCGLYVISFTDMLLELIEKIGIINRNACADVEKFVVGKRISILYLIKKMREITF